MLLKTHCFIPLFFYLIELSIQTLFSQLQRQLVSQWFRVAHVYAYPTTTTTHHPCSGVSNKRNSLNPMSGKLFEFKYDNEIRIGSLGAGNSPAYVSNVIVNRATLSGTTNGVRIKTWQEMNFGLTLSDMLFRVGFYIVTVGRIRVSAVQVSNVVYRNIRGTSASNVAMKFNCSQRTQIWVFLRTVLRLDQNILLAVLMKSVLEVCSVEDTMGAYLILSFGNSTRNVHATFKKSLTTTSEPEAQEAVKKVNGLLEVVCFHPQPQKVGMPKIKSSISAELGKKTSNSSRTPIVWSWGLES
ncbi:hypothetical protein V6N11_032991 [Hibiscus sabdariffa]|uniref:Uncharacterized protein n=1 Tax=Hibiscus sabdariffa TaxID=183260 RepID=A0ABR1ZZ49_9ROSI